jgi:putative membrane protein insertion efficiency factor
MNALALNLKRIPTRIALLLITLYRRTISPFLPRVCRFTPTCSEYGFQAFSTYPFLKALWLTIKRISRCHPFHRGGYDPLP